MKKAIQIFLGLVIVGLIYVIATLIHNPLSFEKELKTRNAEVVVKLKAIRAAERAYKSKYQQFTNNFDSLIYFILNDSLEMFTHESLRVCEKPRRMVSRLVFLKVLHLPRRKHLSA